MTGPQIIDGQLAQPDLHAVWECLACRRREDDEQGRLTSVVCAGDPITGASHRPTSMTRSPARG